MGSAHAGNRERPTCNIQRPTSNEAAFPAVGGRSCAVDLRIEARVAGFCRDGVHGPGLRFSGVGIGSWGLRGPKGFEVLDFLAELAGEGFQDGSGGVADGTAEKFLFEGGEAVGGIGQLLTDGGGEFLGDAVVVVGSVGLELGLGLAVPGDKSGFADAETATDGGEAQAVNAEAEELVTGREGVHGSVGQRESAGGC